MNSKYIALLSGVSCIAVLATYAWAASHEAKAVKVEEVAANVEESAETARLCIPMAEANDATAAVAETDEATAEAKTEASDDEAKTEESAEAGKSEEGAAEVALPICDEDGNPPAPEGEAADSEADTAKTTEKTAEEPAKTE